MNDTAHVVSFDLEHPPIDAPAGCVDTVMWQLAYRMLADHGSLEGVCGSCAGEAPCFGQELAHAGLATAIGQPTEHEDYWVAYVSVLARHGVWHE